MTIHREGYPTLVLGFVLLFILNAAMFFFFPFLFHFILGISVVFFIFLISFFRKPDRTIENIDTNSVYSPCDGRVVVIEKVIENEFLKEECIQVSIFMSPLNVHINWFPNDAEVLYSEYHSGKYLAAWNPKASTENERTTVAYTTQGYRILLRQVAGALARRIVCYAKKDEKYKQGDEMGFIKFGSRVDVYLPLTAKINVNLEDVVQGNRTVLAQFT